MLRTYQQLSGCAPSRNDDVYVFAIAPTANHGLAAITSADELLLLNRDRLNSHDLATLQGVPQGVTSLVVADQGTTAICAGGDGNVAFFDLRTGSKTTHFNSDSMIWLSANTEVNDEITALDFHPSRDSLLLTGGDDGVACIFDIQIQEEQDSLLQAVNHGPIHKAGFLGLTDLYALSSDQNLALHSITVDDADTEVDQTPAADDLGDLRPTVPCEYVIDVLQSGPEHVVACGSHSQSRVDLVKVERGTGISLDQRIVLQGAHGEEIVRSVYVDEENGTIFTAGEDGRIAAFRLQGTTTPPSKPAKSKRPSDNPDVRLNAKYDWSNVEIKDQHLIMKQRGFSQEELSTYGTVSDDRSEIDIELVTPGTSLVENTISFTSHPSLDADGRPIPGATVLRSLNESQFGPDTFCEYRFDSHPDLGVRYFVDGELVHTNTRNVPSEGMGGSLQFKIWADNNRWWSGTPSTTDVLLSIQTIVAYFNTSTPDPDREDACEAAGGPSAKTICTVE
ncbi:hypothetical protein H2200_004948 [Cladophialophora chaetospira]|uniref:Uncharacterized protein n=1 Tax=Cladophialophora chaetospira TaxID=386627 RepID=A0AA39CKY3_9EURO|nr:hypothetical protein H2200_004948 [Cladophialophora chaetospira]